jgi:O-antigen ligase
VGAFVVLWQLVAFFEFGFRDSLVNEVIRVLSILAVFAIAAAVAGSIMDLPGFTLLLFIPAVVFGFISLFLRLPHTIVNERFTFSFSHPNSAGVYLGVAFLVALSLSISTRRVSARIVALGSLILLATTASLTSLLATGVASVLLVAVSPYLSFVRKLQIDLVGILCAFAVVQFLDVSNRFEEFTSKDVVGDPDSFQWRLENWRLLVDEWKSSKLLGFGSGTTNSLIAPLGGPPHNIYVQVLVEYGLIGIVLFIAGYLVFIRRAFIMSRRGTGHLSGVSFALLSYLAICGVAGNTLGYTAAMYAASATIGLAFGARGSLDSDEYLVIDKIKISKGVSA